MSDVIDFLERLGEDSGLRYASASVIEGAMEEAHISPELRAALARGDQRSLEQLLGAATNVCCMIHAPLREEEPADPRKWREKEDAQSAASQVPLSRIA